MSEEQKRYTVTSTRGKYKTVPIERHGPEHELAIGLRRILLDAVKLLEIYTVRKWGD